MGYLKESDDLWLRRERVGLLLLVILGEGKGRRESKEREAIVI